MVAAREAAARVVAAADARAPSPDLIPGLANGKVASPIGLASRQSQLAFGSHEEACVWDWERRGGAGVCVCARLRPGFDPGPSQRLGGLAHGACQRRVVASAHGGLPGLKTSGTTMIATTQRMGKCESLLGLCGVHDQEVTHLLPAPWSRRTDRHDENDQKRRFARFRPQVGAKN